MNKEDFEQKSCNSGKNIQFAPKKRIKINFEKFVEFLNKKKFPIEIETPSLLIFRVGGLQINLNTNGKIIARTESNEMARNAFLEILPGL